MVRAPRPNEKGSVQGWRELVPVVAAVGFQVLLLLGTWIVDLPQSRCNVVVLTSAVQAEVQASLQAVAVSYGDVAEAADNDEASCSPSLPGNIVRPSHH